MNLHECQDILDRAHEYVWTVQGFGQMRTYLDPEKRYRLNIYTADFRRKGVSTIHDHPWSFTSWILSGCLNNHVYVEAAVGGPTHEAMTIETGEGGGPLSTKRSVRLEPMHVTPYLPGETYYEPYDAIHEVTYTEGTVTLNDRTPPNEAHSATVYWPAGQEWVSAEPRVATPEEVEYARKLALRKLY